jgi:hypothetical protein
MRPAPADPDPELIESLVACPAVIDERLSLVRGRTIAEIDKAGFRAVNQLGGSPRGTWHDDAREHCGEQRT